MRQCTAYLLVFLLVAAIPLSAQEVSSQIPTPAIRVTTRLVMVDVVVTDKEGKPVTNLKPGDFTIEENGKKQKLTVFALQQAAAGTPATTTRPNVYSNRPEYRGPLTVLLIDALNTPVQNQMYARQLLLRYVASQLRPDQRMAVYALAKNLIRLQDFTGDPELLRAAIEKFIPQTVAGVPSPGNPRTAAALATSNIRSRGSGFEEGGTPATSIKGKVDIGNQVASDVIGALDRFQQEQIASALQVRIGTTVTALRALANTLAGHPGRKNLVWVSASFPFSPLPEDIVPVSQFNRAADPTAPPPLPNETGGAAVASQIHNSFNDEIRRTTTLISDAQISVYPVDARGLFGSLLTDASSSGLNAAGLLMMGHEFGTSVASSNAALVASQNTMKDFAMNTGGKVFINRNDIDRAVGLASSDGSSYYEIGYSPEKKKFDGGFRKIKVSVSQPGVNVRHRTGYFAFDTTKTSSKERDAALASAISNDAPATLVLFDAQVIPPDASNKASVPIRFLVPASSFTWEDAGSGKRHINLDFYAVAFSPDGKSIANIGKTVDATLESDQFSQLEQQGLLMPLEMSLGPGDYRLKLAVRDNRTGYVGTVHVPLTLAKPTG
jgi:VWFA-related protein